MRELAGGLSARLREGKTRDEDYPSNFASKITSPDKGRQEKRAEDRGTGELAALAQTERAVPYRKQEVDPLNGFSNNIPLQNAEIEAILSGLDFVNLKYR